MSQKIIRDPLYNYVAIDGDRDGWLLDLLNAPEVQRLRRIHQLGVSNLTYPGAEHSRLSHSLGVLHLMQTALAHFGDRHPQDPQLGEARNRLLAAALLHDVGHGPFSHLLEKCIDDKRDHEAWTCLILKDPDTKVHRILQGIDWPLPDAVSALVDKKNNKPPRWQKSLLSSQLDVDRLDYLRRDSLFTGAGYGHYDWYRLLHSMRFSGPMDRGRDVVWDAKAELAIEEYIFSRYYMYWNVYLHKTTRGFEQTLRALFRHARQLYAEGTSVGLLGPLAAFWDANHPSVAQYLAIEESTVLHQVQAWADGSVRSLSDLARRFLHRQPWSMIEAPKAVNPLEAEDAEWNAALRELVGRNAEFDPPDLYCLKDTVGGKYLEPYVPEKEGDEQEVGNAIRVLNREGQPVEISKLRPRLQPITTKPQPAVRYFVPREVRSQAESLRADFAARPERQA